MISTSETQDGKPASGVDVDVTMAIKTRKP